MTIHCTCGDTPHCPFHATVFRGETALDRIHRNARAAVIARLGDRSSMAYDGPYHSQRRAFDLAVLAELDARLRMGHHPVEVGLATPESIAAAKHAKPWMGAPE